MEQAWEGTVRKPHKLCNLSVSPSLKSFIISLTLFSKLWALLDALSLLNQIFLSTSVSATHYHFCFLFQPYLFHWYADCVSISPILHVISVGKNVASIPQFAAITCIITDALLKDLDVRWQLPNGTYLSNTTGRFHLLNNSNSEIILVIERAFYQDNGTYLCKAKNSSDNDWNSASVELVLLGKFCI